ncbi:tyrosine-type recombinase/integrase [Sphingobium sp. AP49]|uniref:tyrosine-type recombinase/integrase n=1 Tax=Sphingobium sp. AP49 TaxID=1144307 RepID=UPI00026EDED2|nr:tyrosine-type recombinase/integrase [Sphingobium sp. AP49]WHO39127.1 tyrosine-type recombinase/integrase [Sphingobium sp. AP49]
MNEQIMKARERRTKPATVTEVNSLARKPGRHSIGESLILCVSESGAKSWVARVRDSDGRRRDMGLGPFADLTLAEAREKARTLRKAGRDGLPILTRAERRKALRKVPTFKEAAETVYERDKGEWKNEKHGAQWIKTLRDYAFPSLGSLSINRIEENHVAEALAPIWREKPETARRVLQRVLTVMDWGHAFKHCTVQLNRNGIRKLLGKQDAAKGNFAAMPYGEVSGLVAMLRSKETIGNMALEFLILTAARSGEVRGAIWDEFDLEGRLWIIPAERMKAKKEHNVPLCDRALALVKRAQEIASSETVVFPGLRGKPMSDATMAKALREAGISKEVGTVHGMRSAFRDWVSEETSFPGDVAEAALAHTIKNKVEAAYRRGKLLAKRREMMAAWERHCQGGSNVVRMVAG